MCFAEKAVKTWMPSEVCTIDICRSEDAFKILECNCFNASGFYESDLMGLVAEISAHQEAKFV